ncbi:MAG: diaminopimelate epimerase [Novosphingobium sp.]|uniref:diaminopimelate epimerase n=1 Tax=Novosphingobium sp. TaxID=1874826 RepID=UPI0032BE1B70
MRVPFIKMHGLGNDFVVLDGRVEALPDITPRFALALADRHTGIGCDQLIVLGKSDTADLQMRIYNHDGGEVESCGNASRAIGLLLGCSASIETRGGLLQVDPSDGGIAVDMGEPRFEWDQIPLAYPMDTHHMPVAWELLDNPAAVNVGNPHVIFFVKDKAAIDLGRLGPEIEHDPLFPDRINVNVAAIESRSRIGLRVWERGVGETRACGTGACATAIAAMRRGLVDRTVEVILEGGAMTIEWTPQGRIRMIGPAAESFRGSFETADFGAAD